MSEENQDPKETGGENLDEDWQNLVLDRKTWYDKAEEEFREAGEKGIPVSAIFVDLNYFKSVNDTFGHDVGDTVIEDVRDLVSIMVHSFRVENQAGQERELDLVTTHKAGLPLVNGQPIAGHIGGDEFVVIAKTDAEGAQMIAQRLRSIFHDYINNPDKPERANLRELDIDLAIGTATSNPQIHGLADLLRAADISMYEDKLSGLDLDEHQKHAIRMAWAVLRAANVRIRDIPKIIRMHPELFENEESPTPETF